MLRELSGLLENIVHTIKLETKCHGVIIAFVSEMGNLYVREAISDANIIDSAGLCLEGNLFRRIIREECVANPVAINNPEEQLGYCASDAGVSSFAGVPIIFNGKCTGVLAADIIDGMVFPPNIIEYLSTFSDEIALLQHLMAAEEKRLKLHRSNIIGSNARKGSEIIGDCKARAGLAARFTFDSFVESKANKYAFDMAMFVASEHHSTFSALYIHGLNGTGKSHLLNAIGNKLVEGIPNLRIRMVTGEAFVNELMEALALGKTSEFRNRYRSLDVLLLDDVQFLAGNKTALNEFFHTFEELSKAQKLIVVTGDMRPKDIPEMDSLVSSRLDSGIVAEIFPPCVETKKAILMKKAQM